jgi:hypothetical protein
MALHVADTAQSGTAWRFNTHLRYQLHYTILYRCIYTVPVLYNFAMKQVSLKRLLAYRYRYRYCIRYRYRKGSSARLQVKDFFRKSNGWSKFVIFYLFILLISNTIVTYNLRNLKFENFEVKYKYLKELLNF